MMKTVLGGFASIALAAGLVIGGTGAFFSDTETSANNVFAAGAFDLLIDNESYYNGNKCENVGTEDEPVWEWIGEASYPVPGTSCTTSFGPSNLDEGFLFFDFNDVKPDDEGEDTISINIQNDAWACMDMTLTSNDDATSTEPELAVDEPEDVNDTWDGELAQTIEFIWWADDGDNVYEQGENLLTDGVESLYDLAYADGPFSVALADRDNNAWGLGAGTPLPANETVYIAKAWCAGTLTPDPLGQDGEGKTGDNGPMERGTGISCDGTELSNETQMDVATVDVAFRAVQARHNGEYVCEDTEPRLATLTVTKVVDNSNGGNNVVEDFQLIVLDDVPTNVTSGEANQFAAGDYIVTETGIPGYVPSFSGDCDATGAITLEPGDDKACTITNTALPGSVTLEKNVDGGPAIANQFQLLLNGSLVQQNTSQAVDANTPLTIGEMQVDGYEFTSISGVSSRGTPCPSALGEPFELDEGDSITCTITNTFVE
ncbi:hypothetical protein GVX82_02935 [Patescibacteria group bacterium]|jgi:predicted ribosomally synthesized peptide with SipW-like signal peptide|nr:hypothetical protein [Patescibacteria group bacterium]